MKPAHLSFLVFLFSAFLPAAAVEKEAKAVFSANDLPADRDGASILTIGAAGRYAIRAHSPSGARIELIDMIAGPGDASGQPGLRDGRIDALLDKGAYKIRVTNAKNAAGKVKLAAEPFVEANAQKPTLAQGRIESSELADLQQRSFKLEVDASGRVGVEAAGRALADLRLWREDGALVELPLQRSSVEPKPGRPMTRLRIEGALAPGRYVATAYGGEQLVWSEGGAAQPLLVRLDPPALLAAGAAQGVIGPFGAARFEAPAGYNAFRLELPQIAPARIDAERSRLRQSARIDKTSREPVAALRLADDDKQPTDIEIAGREGQTFSLRAVRQASRHAFEAEGPHRIWLDVAGEGADEVAATALLARIDKEGKAQVLAADAPKVGQGRAYRARFNLRGPTSILFEAATSGPVSIETKGIKAHAEIQPALGALAPRADGRNPSRYDLQQGFYFLSLEPQGDAVGVVDVTLGPPGLTAALPPPPTPRAVISFGDQKLDKDGSYLILANAAPSLLTGPRVVALPADLAKAPLPLFQPAGAEISVPVRAPKAGAISARDEKGAPVALTLADEKTENDLRSATVKIAPSDKARAIGLVFAPEPSPTREDAAKPGGPTLAASLGKPSFFDLGRNETKQLRFDIPQGGLYRIETLGRLRTALEVGASFSPGLGLGEDNGPGHNGLVTTYLRAGPYRASVTAKDSNGHLGLAVTQGTLVTTPAIAGAGEARATLDAGKGALVPLEIPHEGLYKIELLGLQRDWRARLEDADGWPLTKPGEMRELTRRFEKGAYRLVVLPEDVEARMVARLAPIVTPAPLSGHGPHDLLFDAPQKLQWREPQAKDAPRAPDIWRFSLAGEADVELAISEGMVAEIFKGEKDGLGKAAGVRKFNKRLGAGDYRVEARALSRDDRLDYEISLSSKELQPGVPRRVEPPATLAFSLASDRVVDLSSFGDRELTATLKSADGALVVQVQSRADDWNLTLSRRLPAGAYALELIEPNPRAAAAGEETQQSEEAGAQAEEASEEASEQAEQPGEGQPPRGVEIRFALPAEKTAGTLAWKGSQKLSGAVAQILAVPPAPEGYLMLIAARSPQEIALSVERREADGAWRPVGLERGRAPVLAWPTAREERRLVVWPIGGAAAEITLTTRLIDRRGRAPGEIALEPVEDLGLCVGLAALPSAALVVATVPEGGLIAGSAPGAPLRPIRSGPLAPQSDRLWLTNRGDCKEKAGIAAFDWTGAEITLDLAAGQRAELPPSPAPRGKARLWIARAAEGHAGLESGRGMAVSGAETLALGAAAPLRLWNASGDAPLRLTLRAVDVALSPAAQGGLAWRGTLPPLTALPLTMNRGPAALELDLPAGVAALAAPNQSRVFSDYAGETPLSLVENRASDALWLVNLSETPAPARVAVAPGAAETLVPGKALSGFHGAAGRIVLPVAAEPGDRLTAIGGTAAFISDRGAVVTGATMTLDGGGAVLLDHPPGLAALWLERAGKGPWPAATPRKITLPQRLALEGAAVALALAPQAPGMLHLRADAPAIVAFTQNGKREIEAFAAGVELRRYVDAGAAALDIYAPNGGALSGLLDIDLEAAIAAREGINDPVTLAPGAHALFTFETEREGEIGVGLRAEPDRAQARLLDIAGRPLGEGVGQLRKLSPGRYFVEVAAPADAPLSVVRLAIVGLSPPPVGPPEEVVAEFLEKAGLKKNKR